MNLFRTLGSTIFVALAGLSFTGCSSAPDYAVEPDIDFRSLTITKNRPGNGQLAVDTLNFAIDFRDGDGDLGLSDNDIKRAPYNATTGGPNNRGFSYNYFIQPYVRSGGPGTAFVKFITPFGFQGEYDGRYLRLDGNADGSESKAAPLRGTLRYKLPLFLDGAVYRAGQVLYFEISIMDRELHQSNVIKTSEVTLGQ
ncbi:hypothetical protein [Hymenobacter glacialis]|uniref:Lipoprotein n=1 Tax=Hymenobacter glacialis TaxID=1908236 RepID=A0A1G1TCC2_9BACT|nr:hypothetical protein [Hymenobacter glacialis]OGX88522.1 hypothetical protein BEN48_09020 [Hymenobacter glacialis]